MDSPVDTASHKAAGAPGFGGRSSGQRRRRNGRSVEGLVG